MVDDNLDDNLYNFDWGVHALLGSFQYPYKTVLDVGSGASQQARLLRHAGKDVFTIDKFDQSADFVGDFMDYQFDRKFDCIYCSHVVEHQRNLGLFLEKIYSLLNDDGILAMAAPGHASDRIIIGHLTTWNLEYLIYNLVLSGFDCSKGHFFRNYDLSAVVQKRPATGGDIGSTSAYNLKGIEQYFPYKFEQGSPANRTQINWPKPYSVPKKIKGVTIKGRFLKAVL